MKYFTSEYIVFCFKTCKPFVSPQSLLPQCQDFHSPQNTSKTFVKGHFGHPRGLTRYHSFFSKVLLTNTACAVCLSSSAAVPAFQELPSLSRTSERDFEVRGIPEEAEALQGGNVIFFGDGKDVRAGPEVLRLSVLVRCGMNASAADRC